MPERFLRAVLFQIFLQTQTLRHDNLCMIAAYVTVMPRFIADFGDIDFVFGIAQNKAVFRAMLLQPGKLIGIFKVFFQ